MADNYTNLVVPPNSSFVLSSGDTVTGTNNTALRIQRNSTVTLSNGPVAGPITINSSGTNGHGIWTTTDGSGSITGTSLTFGSGVTTNISTNGNLSYGIHLGAGAQTHLVFEQGSTTNIRAYLGMMLGASAAATPALTNDVVLRPNSIVNIDAYQQPGIFQGISMSGGASLHLDAGSQLSVHVADGGTTGYDRGILVSQNVNTGLGGILTSDAGSLLTIDTHSNNQSDGLYTINTGRSDLRGVTQITTTGDLSAGAFLYADPDMTRLTISAEGPGRSSISTSGTESEGLFIYRGHALIGRTDVSTTGDTSAGAFVYGPESSLVTEDSTITTVGSGSDGVVVHSGATVSGSDTDIAVSGAGSIGLFLTGSGTEQTASFSGGSIASNGTAIGVGGGTGGVSLDGVTVKGIDWLDVKSASAFRALPTVSFGIDQVADDGTLVRTSLSPVAVVAAGSTTANVTARNSTLTGAAFTEPGSVSNVTLVDTLWTMTGSSNLTNLINDPSLIQYTPPVGDPTVLASYKTLTVANYVGQGGEIGLNTYLGADGSPSDRLIVDGGTITGNSTLAVKNTTGPGALTTGDGILVVDTVNGATSVPTAFTLASDYVTEQGEPAVVGGAYAYTLHYGGVGANATDNNWYLRSDAPSSTPGSPEPLYQPGDPVYQVYPQVLMALQSLPTMQQRVGNRYWTEPAVPEQVFCKDPTQNFRCTVTPEQASYYGDGKATIESNAIWTRIDGLHGHYEPRTATASMDYDMDIWRLQAGLDGLLYDAKDGAKLVGGVSFHYGRAVTDVSSVFGDGSLRTDGYGFGGTLTWLDSTGFYVDGQASLSWFESDLFSDAAHRDLQDNNGGFGYALSVETGKKIELHDDWTVTPQIQLAYSNVRFDSFTDTFGARISSGGNDSLLGRLGVSADKDASWKDEAGKTRRSHLYGIANLYYEFLDPSVVEVSGVGFETGNERLWGGLGVGGSYNWNDDKYSVYAELSANTSLKSLGDSYSLNGTAGFRVKW
ncbi:autotransporter outer membrane beta-barrel domain-containing protein [Rhizobium lusitanum]|uniref:Autotransporter outer membrane beta-barrel domain-containing protein n=1 Tax=Rhizobium lusitanum TaxID=293958 RepID=A0A6L9UDN5_9HYPH|nr:autotransporter outer membrane beta-barrel domain-containing protein [Rhizobium lusitanum]NEI72352.1 autotransporter outer membrane beta-barrel domain-containing protein [Rhizobium lusitanum]